ncbi:MAG: tryptophan synthase subunit alpha [Phycisphaerae bacterium]|nr:tryptophan synthase subunit alpha [Phycisphaerae bacterium]
MKSYKDVFSELNHTALIPFFVIGDPDFDTSLDVAKTAIDSGADILELGISFSDPIADGPTIQKADIRAAKAGATLQKALEFIRQVKQYKDIPIGLLMYYNLIYQYGKEKFFKDFHAAGVNSVLIADLDIDDADEVSDSVKSAGLDTVFMVTPNTSDARMKTITSQVTGFVYTVSLLGVTGGRNELSQQVESLIKRLKNITDKPICVGFGISTPDHAATVAQAGADGVIIGSRLVDMIEKNLNDKQKTLTEIAAFLRSVRTALDKTQNKR